MTSMLLHLFLITLFCYTTVKAGNYTFDIEDYGADPSGSADSTASIQNAIDAAQAIGGLVIIPPGQFRVTSTLVVSGTVRMQGISPQSSTLLGDVPSDAWILQINGATGVVLTNFGFRSATPGLNNGLLLTKSFIMTIQNLQFHECATAMWSITTGNLDVNSVNIWNIVNYGIRIQDTNGDAFFTNIHVNTASKTSTGLYLSNVSGAKFTNCDFLGGAFGVLADLNTQEPNPFNQWLQFLSVDCDTVAADPWHFESAQGLQMSECWSGSFPAGTGIWLGPGVKQASIVNHQCQSGDICIGNNSPSVTMTGGIICNVATAISSSVAGQPVTSNVAIY